MQKFIERGPVAHMLINNNVQESRTPVKNSFKLIENAIRSVGTFYLDGGTSSPESKEFETPAC